MQARARVDCAEPVITIERAIADLTETLADEYGATPDPSEDDELHSPIVRPNILRLRGVIALLRALSPLFLAGMSLQPWLTRAGMRLAEIFFSA